MIKTCTKCEKELPATLEYFYFRKDSGKLRNGCKKCQNAKSESWRKKNQDKIKLDCRRRRKENPEYYNAISKRYRDRNPEKRYHACTDWRKDNPEKSNAIQKKSYTKRRSTPRGNIEHRMGVSIQKALKENKNGRKWESLVDYTLDDLKKHIEELFTNGMTWDKLLDGDIHIDHIIPKCVFNYTKPEHMDFKRCWSLKNLQPLWAGDNISKHGNLDKPFQPSLMI